MNGIRKRIFASKFLRNAGWMMLARVYQMLLALVIGVISARYLGPGNYGTIHYAAAYVSFFSGVCVLGLEGVVVKEMIDDREREGIVLGTSIIMRAVAGFLSLVAVGSIVAFVNPDDSVLMLVAVLESLVLPFSAAHIIDAWYQSYLRSKVSTCITCAAATSVALYKVWLLVMGKSVEWFAFSSSLDALFIAALFMYSYGKDGKFRLEFHAATGKRLIGLSYPLVLSSIAVAAYHQTDRLMIGAMIDQTHVGYYAAASTICYMWLFIPQALANSIRPSIMELKGKDEGLYIRRIKQLNCVIFWLGVSFALLITMLSGFIIDVLYGAQYAQAKEPLLLIIWSAVFASLSYARNIWMLCENKQKYTLPILVCGMIVNLVLNWITIPVLGMNGAAAATLATEAVGCLIAPLMFRETREYVRYIISSINIKGMMGAKSA